MEKQVQKEQEAAEQEVSTEIVARKIAEATGTQLTKEDKKTAGQVVHYTFGTLMGIVYCVSAELLPGSNHGCRNRLRHAALPRRRQDRCSRISTSTLNLGNITDRSSSTWAAHVVYGGSLELVRRLMKRLM